MRWLFVLLLWSAPALADDDGVFGSPFRFTETSGASIYTHVCAGCHMPDGRGAVGAAAYPSLADDARLAAVGYPIGVVLRGQRAMPPFGRTLSDSQVADVVDYIRTHFGNNYAPPPTETEIRTAR